MPEEPAFLRVTCDGCGKSLKAKPKLAGRAVQCPRCGARLQVPATDTKSASGNDSDPELDLDALSLAPVVASLLPRERESLSPPPVPPSPDSGPPEARLAEPDPPPLGGGPSTPEKANTFVPFAEPPAEATAQDRKLEGGRPDICAKCGAKKSFFVAMVIDHVSGTTLCQACEQAIYFQRREKAIQVAAERIKQLTEASKAVIVTTTTGIDGYRVAQYLGIESVEFVIGTGIFSEVSSSFADFLGRRSSAFETKLRAAKEEAMKALKYIAAEKGANAVVAVDLDYTEFTGNRIALIINGTLVVIEPANAAS